MDSETQIEAIPLGYYFYVTSLPFLLGSPAFKSALFHPHRYKWASDSLSPHFKVCSNYFNKTPAFQLVKGPEYLLSEHQGVSIYNPPDWHNLSLPLKSE